MEYYNVNTPEYRKALKRNLITRYLLKLELLTYYETPIGDITKEIGIDAKGQININYNQLTRRSCSLNIANVEGKYLPSPNSPIWYNRKFKLWVGIMTHTGDIYWFSQGVYLIVSAHANAHTVSIEAVDKGGALDGTLKTNMADVQYIAKKGMSITDTIRDTLSLNMGGIGITNINGAMGGANIAIDPIPPLIDMRYNEQKLKTDVSVDENNYIGDLLISVANSYGADIYYDTQGHLRLDAMADLFIVEGYRYMAHQWDFVDLSQPDYVYEFNAINAVTVYTNLSAKSQALANAQKENETSVRLKNKERETVNDFNDIKQDVEDNNIDLSQTVFGNIDTNNRQILEWTDENLTRFAEAIASWGESPDDLRGTISTVFGAWDTFDDVNIAFSPILQTQSGAYLLSADVVWDYINALINQAGDGWTTEELLVLDATGLTIDNIAIKGLIASVGEEAERVSMIMHYVGEYGAYNLAYREVESIAASYGVSVEEIFIANEIQTLEDIKVKNISYTAYNINPRSPASVAAIGVRRMDSQEIDYMDTTQSDMEARAQQYAIMLLQKESIKGMNVSFNCPIVPHLDVNQTIGLSDEYQGIENGTFVVQSITLPLGAESMKITATNVNWLPTNLDVDIAVVREEEESEVSE